MTKLSHYEKPAIRRESKMTFPLDVIEGAGLGPVCKQCSSCHGCK